MMARLWCGYSVLIEARIGHANTYERQMSG